MEDVALYALVLIAFIIVVALLIYAGISKKPASNTTPLLSLSPPRNIGTTPTSNNTGIVVFWDPQPNAIQYIVYRGNHSEFTVNSAISSINTSNTTATFNNLSPNITHYFKVIAVYPEGRSNLSAAVANSTNNTFPAVFALVTTLPNNTMGALEFSTLTGQYILDTPTFNPVSQLFSITADNHILLNGSSNNCVMAQIPSNTSANVPQTGYLFGNNGCTDTNAFQGIWLRAPTNNQICLSSGKRCLTINWTGTDLGNPGAIAAPNISTVALRSDQLLLQNWQVVPQPTITGLAGMITLTSAVSSNVCSTSFVYQSGTELLVNSPTTPGPAALDFIIIPTTPVTTVGTSQQFSGMITTLSLFGQNMCFGVPANFGPIPIVSCTSSTSTWIFTIFQTTPNIGLTITTGFVNGSFIGWIVNSSLEVIYSTDADGFLVNC